MKINALFCSYCKSEVPHYLEICPDCGEQLITRRAKRSSLDDFDEDDDFQVKQDLDLADDLK